MENNLKAICGLSLSEIEQLVSPRFRARQIYKWILKGATGFEQMTDIPVSLQNELNTRFCLFSGKIVCIHEDGETRKIVLELKDGSKIESVLLSDSKKRLTACISTQSGCPCGCIFCKTGSLGFSRNLESFEIVEQFLHLINIAGNVSRRDVSSRLCENKNKTNDQHEVDNIVVMGMGEPLLNLPNLRKAISVLNDKKGLNFSLRRITVSTCGICGSLFDIANNGPFIRLALSLVTGDEQLRRKLMPITESNTLAKIKEALILFQQNGGSRVTLEVPLLGGVNTSVKDALSISDFAKGLNTVVNIIPWNPVTGLEFEGKPLREPDKKETKDFFSILENQKLKVTMRLRKGKSINGACGQLGANHPHCPSKAGRGRTGCQNFC